MIAKDIAEVRADLFLKIFNDAFTKGMSTVMNDKQDNQTVDEKPFLETGEEFEYTKALKFIFERLVHIHGENESYDYMHKLKGAISMVERMEEPTNRLEPMVFGRMPTYKYEQAKFDKALTAFDEFNNGDGLYFDAHQHLKSDKNFIQIGSTSELLRWYDSNNLYRRIELTPEDIEAKEVEELAREFSDIALCQFNHLDLSANMEAAISRMARHAIKKLKG